MSNNENKTLQEILDDAKGLGTTSQINVSANDSALTETNDTPVIEILNVSKWFDSPDKKTKIEASLSGRCFN